MESHLFNVKTNKFSFSTTKIIFSIFCVIVTLSLYAVPSLGTTRLLYKDSLALDTLLNKISKIPPIAKPKNRFQLDEKIMQVVARQMPGFQNQLNTVLVESGYYTVFDAEPELNIWRSKDLAFLRMVYKTTEVEPPINKPESKTYLITPPASNLSRQPRKLILIGWIENITDTKNKDRIFGTNKVSFIFSIDIRTEFRLINTRTNKVIAAFTAVGHSGIAKILPSLDENVTYDVDGMVNDMFYSLARDVRHGIRLKQQQFIKEKIQLENVVKKSAVDKR
jgi:hypothetical protein